MNSYDALCELKKGKRVKRKGWNKTVYYFTRGKKLLLRRYEAFYVVGNLANLTFDDTITDWCVAK